MKKINLGGTDWKLIYVKNETLNNDGYTSDVSVLKDRAYPQISATVPGNLEIDLQNAGIIEDPFYADNHQKRDCEYLHCFYTKEFDYDGSFEDPELLFEGIDTIADIYLNGTLIASTDNMLISHRISTAGTLKAGKNTLTVHIKPAVIEARKYLHTVNDHAFIYNAESLYIRKAPHMYAWDIMPRLVSAGIWRPCAIVERKKDRIVDFYCYTCSCDAEKNTARLDIVYNTQISADNSMEYTLKVHGQCGDSVFELEKPLWHTSGSAKLDVSDAKLWWPKFNGEQNLYDVTVTLSRNGEVLDTYKTRTGLRTVELDRTSTTDENGDGEFVFKVNGKRIFCMGSNWVPVDALHSRDRARMPDILPMLNDINCNIIRTWGGNVYEDEYLYDFCDENGILIWQDFVMGCATYPQEKEFRERLYKEAVAVIKKYRDHPSLILYAGDNECDTILPPMPGIDPNDNLLTRSVLKEAVRLYDYTRPYLPSSPYLDEDAFKSKKRTSEDHLWGPRDYFKGNFYKNTVCHFASETGYHGCPSPKSLEKYIPKEQLWTSLDSEKWTGIDNDMWIAHAASPDRTPSSPYTYRIRLMADQVSTLFGKSVPNTLEDFAKASQISQAEAKKYFIERFRISKWRRTGIIWWNLIDGWPQISDAVVDYYYVKKLAYHYIKRSQEPVCMMFDEPSNNMLPLYAVNEFSHDCVLKYEVSDLTENKNVASGTALAQADSSLCICRIKIHPAEKHFYLIKWKLDGKEYSNHYVTNIIDLDFSEYMGYIKKCGYDEFEGF